MATPHRVYSLANVTVFTIADAGFIRMMHNFYVHMTVVLPELPFEMHAADGMALAACQSFARPPARCVDAPLAATVAEERPERPQGPHGGVPVNRSELPPSWFENNSTLTYYERPIYRHKIATLLKVMHRSEVAVLLDATSLVRSRTCLNEWLAHQEDIVGSSEGSNPGLFVKRYGQVVNTGAVLFRHSTIGFVRHCYEQMRSHAFSGLDQGDQLYINYGLLHHHFAWTTPRRSGHDRVGASIVAGHNMTVRFMNADRWPRVANASAGDEGCLFHPWVHSDREGFFRDSGFWYL